MPKWLDVLKFSIHTNCPISMIYSSNKSPFFPDAEAPEHPRVIQPLVVGYKMLKNGKKGAFVRAYLLSDYSYSLNDYMNNKTTQNNRTPRYFRLYNVAKMRNVTLASDFDLKKRWFPQSHRSVYNPNDKFFDQILYNMPSDYSFSYSTVVRESAHNQYIIKKILETIKKYKIKYSKPIYFYESSECEEVGFLNGKNTMLNLIWAKQINEKYLAKGLKSLQ